MVRLRLTAEGSSVHTRDPAVIKSILKHVTHTFYLEGGLSNS